jgi:hypothetical protein
MPSSFWHSIACLFVLSHLSLCIVEVEAKQPNILLILADDLGYADVDWHDTK